MKKILIASVLSALFAAPAFAAAPGPYIALDLQSWSATNTAPFGNPGMGLRIGGGYRFTPNWGVEANYAQSGASSSVLGASYKVSALQVAAVGTYAINPQFDVFAKLGVSANKLNLSGVTCNTAGGYSCSKTDLLYGVGGQFNINQQWGVRVEYESLGNATSGPANNMGVSTLSVGGVYAF